MSNVAPFPKRDVIIIIGKTGFGKSTWLNKYARGLPRIFAFDPFRAFPAEYISGEELITRFETGKFREHPRYSLGTYALSDLELFGSVAYETGNCAFVIEECGVAFYKGERISECMQEWIFLGRHKSLTLIFTAQRATSIPIELRSQASRFVTFRQTEKSDVKWTGEYIGDLVDELPNLDELECIDADKKSVTRYRISPLGQ